MKIQEYEDGSYLAVADAKGQVFLTKSCRKKVGLKPRDVVLISVPAAKTMILKVVPKDSKALQELKALLEKLERRG